MQEILMHPIVKALSPAHKHFPQAHVLSRHLNEFPDIEIIAFTVRGLPHIKAVPAFGMMMDDLKHGRYEGKDTIVVPSSGNTAHAVVRLAPAFGFKKVIVVLANDVPPSKRGIIAALSTADVHGTSQSTMDVAREFAAKPGAILLDQYNHPANARSHEQFTGPALIQALGRRWLSVLAVSMGSAGTMMGISRYLRKKNILTAVVGVRPAPGQQSPGTRDAKKMQVVTLPWQEYTDCIIEQGGRKESFIEMRRLWSEVEPQPGPSSGLAFDGLLRYLRRLSVQGRVAIKGSTAAFICPDDGRFYPEYTLGELDVDEGI